MKTDNMIQSDNSDRVVPGESIGDSSFSYSCVSSLARHTLIQKMGKAHFGLSFQNSKLVVLGIWDIRICHAETSIDIFRFGSGAEQVYVYCKITTIQTSSAQN
jgi:hypothetical protein